MTTRVEPIPAWRAGCWWMAAVALNWTAPSALIFVQETLAQETTPAPAQANGEEFPDGITPSHVFSRLDLLDRCLDRLMAARNITAPELPPKMESRLGPLHVYQLVLASSMRVQTLDDQAGVLAMPTLSAKPRFYAPRDVLLVSGLMFDGVQRVATTLNIEDLPTNEATVSDKTPTEVYGRAVSVFLKLNALCGYDDISPGEVYAEMVRAADDVRSILRQADSESRYRIDAPSSEPDQVPGDVFDKCRDVRGALNKHRIALGQPAVPLPSPPSGYEIRPRDVFLQTQVIIAELNFLKLYTDTISSTPLAVPVNSKTPTDVHEQASLIEYLLGQVETGAENSVGASD